MMFLLLFHFVLSCLLGLTIYFFLGGLAAVSFAAGAGLGFLNLVLLSFAWGNILRQKMVALSVGVIVFKFAILAWIIYEVVTRELLAIGWFSVGLGVVLVTAMASALQFARANPYHDSEPE